jgi:imidazoleglycerol phosphate synthase glutamine amidotransferase subunit HisH
MLHFVTSYMNQNKERKQILESAQYGLEIIFKGTTEKK